MDKHLSDVRKSNEHFEHLKYDINDGKDAYQRFTLKDACKLRRVLYIKIGALSESIDLDDENEAEDNGGANSSQILGKNRVEKEAGLEWTERLTNRTD